MTTYSVVLIDKRNVTIVAKGLSRQVADSHAENLNANIPYALSLGYIYKVVKEEPRGGKRAKSAATSTI